MPNDHLNQVSKDHQILEKISLNQSPLLDKTKFQESKTHEGVFSPRDAPEIVSTEVKTLNDSDNSMIAGVYPRQQPERSLTPGLKKEPRSQQLPAPDRDEQAAGVHPERIHSASERMGQTHPLEWQAAIAERPKSPKPAVVRGVEPVQADWRAAELNQVEKRGPEPVRIDWGTPEKVQVQRPVQPRVPPPFANPALDVLMRKTHIPQNVKAVNDTDISHLIDEPEFY